MLISKYFHYQLNLNNVLLQFCFYILEHCVQTLAMHLFPFWLKHNYVLCSKYLEYKRSMTNYLVVSIPSFYIFPENNVRRHLKDFLLKFHVKPSQWSEHLPYQERNDMGCLTLIKLFIYICTLRGEMQHPILNSMCFQLLDIYQQMSLHCNRCFYLTRTTFYYGTDRRVFSFLYYRSKGNSVF